MNQKYRWDNSSGRLATLQNITSGVLIPLNELEEGVLIEFPRDRGEIYKRVDGRYRSEIYLYGKILTFDYPLSTEIIGYYFYTARRTKNRSGIEIIKRCPDGVNLGGYPILLDVLDTLLPSREEFLSYDSLLKKQSL